MVVHDFTLAIFKAFTLLQVRMGVNDPSSLIVCIRGSGVLFQLTRDPETREYGKRNRQGPSWTML